MAKKTKAKKKAVTKKAKVVKKVTKKVSKKAIKKTAKKPAKKSAKKITKKSTIKAAPKMASVKKSVPQKPIMQKAVVKSAPKPTKTIVLTPKVQAPVQKPVSASGLKIGQPVPDFQAQATSGNFKLSDLKGKNVVLYFYPKDNTSGCTLEGHDFTAALAHFQAKNTVVFGISKDSIKSHKGFIEKQNYKHNLISDENEKVCQLFGVIKEKNMYGRMYMGIDRSTFLIDAKGNLKAEWRSVKVEGHVQAVLAKI